MSDEPSTDGEGVAIDIDRNGAPAAVEGNDGPTETQDAQPAPGGDEAAGFNAAFACDPNAQTPEPAWRRLTHTQYQNTLLDLVTRWLPDESEAAAVLQAAATPLALLPEDERPRTNADLRGGFRRLDQSVSQAHAEVWYEVAVTIGRELARSDRLAAATGGCDGSESCARDVVTRLGALAFRRPLSNDEVDEYAYDFALDGTYPTGEEALTDVITSLLTAPQFLYLVEHGDSGAEPGERAELTAHELASRLSYHFWNTMPDAELLEAANDGSLLDEEAYAAQVERLSRDPRAEVALRDFFREWLKLENLPALDAAVGQPVFDAFAGDDIPDQNWRNDMIEEVVDLTSFIVMNRDGSFADLMRTEHIVPKTPALARIYGVEISDKPVPAPSGERPGLLTRAAFLATGSANTRPIMKGVFIRENLLCDEIPPPPEAAAAAKVDLSDSLSTRQVVEAITEADGTTCAACHKAFINSLGFPTENYDGLGRLRTEQPLFDEDGRQVGTASVNTHATPSVVIGDPTEVDGVEELAELIIESGKAQACLARHYFRYSAGRFEDLSGDGCALEELRTAVDGPGGVREMLDRVAHLDSFKGRIIAE